MDNLKILFYVVLAMYFLLNAVFIWGAITYKKVKSENKFLNKPLLALTSAIAGIGFIFAWVPIFMKVWEYGDVTIDPAFVAILVLELLFLVAFLLVAYLFAFDFGIALDESGENLQFFGQTVSTSKIIELEEKKYSLKIIYEQGFKNLKKKVIIFTPNAKKFAKSILADIVAVNQANRAALAAEQEAMEKRAIVEDRKTTSTQQIENEQNS